MKLHFKSFLDEILVAGWQKLAVMYADRNKMSPQERWWQTKDGCVGRGRKDVWGEEWAGRSTTTLCNKRKKVTQGHARTGRIPNSPATTGWWVSSHCLLNYYRVLSYCFNLESLGFGATVMSESNWCRSLHAREVSAPGMQNIPGGTPIPCESIWTSIQLFRSNNIIQ